jgi:hypothetical protein
VDATQADDSNAERSSRSISVGAIVATLGGIVIIVGAVLDSVKVSVGSGKINATTLSTSYFDTDNGKVVVVLCAIIVVVGLWTLVRPASSMVPAIVLTAAGLASFGLALSDRINLNDVGDDYRQRYISDRAIGALVHVTVGPALIVVMAGGVIATIGALFASRDR